MKTDYGKMYCFSGLLRLAESVIICYIHIIMPFTADTVQKTLNQLDKLKVYPKFVVALLILVLLSIIGYLDYITGFEIAFSIFYLIPVVVAAWSIGRRWGIFFSVLSAALWSSIDYSSGNEYSNIAILFWNGTVRLGFFFITSAFITSIKVSLEREKLLARIDHVTEISNARSFYESAKREISRANRLESQLTIAYIDLDNFKQVNDELGHMKGDELLKKIALTMKNNLRVTDLAARVGGDEFAIIFPETDGTQAKHIVNVLQSRLSAATEGIVPKVTFSTFARNPWALARG